MKIIAHQGGALQWPGNSMTAFEAIAARPVDGVELDVHLSRDGVPVVLHDPVLRTPAGPRRIADLTARQIAAYGGHSGAGPPLSAVLPLFRSRSAGFEVQVEIKTDAYGRPYPGLVPTLAAVLRAAGLEAQAVIASFLPATLSEVGRLLPEVRLRGGLVPIATDLLGGAFAAIDRYWQAGATIIDVNQAMLDAAILTALGDRGLIAGVATVNGDDALRHWLRQPVTRLITDQPDLALALRAELTPSAP